MPVNIVLNEICLPPINVCNPGNTGNPFFTDCDETWNKIKCHRDKCFFMPYEEGETIYYQNSAGIDLTGISAVDLDGVPIPGAITALIGSAPNQQISVYVPPGSGCFTVINEHPRGNTCIDWVYEPIQACRKTIKLRGMYENGEADCFGNIYPIDNSIRLYGNLVTGKQANIERTVYGRKTKRRKVESYSTIILNEMVPPSIHLILAKQIFSANYIRLEYEGQFYDFLVDESFTLNSVETKNNMFHYGTTLRVKEVCEVAGVC